MLAYGVGVDPLVVERLRQLNRTFYKTYAATFAATRSAPWPGWQVAPGGDLSALTSAIDLGCGNGRYLQYLRSQGFTGRYHGVDECEALVAIARDTHVGDLNASWQHAPLEAALHAETFDLVVAWGVLHHVPGFHRRIALLREMLARVTPGGSLAVSLWQFRKHARFAAHECDPLLFGLADLEEGDALLDWQRDQSVPRYCHHFSDAEIDRIAAAFPDDEIQVHRLVETSDRFNAYLTLRAR